MAKRFERQLDAATDQTLVEPNWEGILECVDAIRGSDVGVKDALSAIQKRIHSSNPHVAHHALLVLEACVKNCGKKDYNSPYFEFHSEVASKEFMDDMKNLVIGGAPDKVRDKVLELIQCWASAFRQSGSEYGLIGDTHQLLRMNGFEFPAMSEADAMFVADSAPEWAEGDNCYRCRVEFSIFTRRHHCRACGQIFCGKCSLRQMLLPQFGIEKMVRVCETCFEKSQAAAPTTKSDSTTPRDPLSTTNANENGEAAAARERQRKEAELAAKEEEELQLALAISQSEAEEKERLGQRYTSSGLYYRPLMGTKEIDIGASTPTATSIYKEPASSVESVQQPLRMDNPGGTTAEDSGVDAVLAKYLDRDYWEKRRNADSISAATPEVGGAMRASAPPPSELSTSSGTYTNQRDTELYSVLDSASVMGQAHGGGMRKQPSANSINTMVAAFAGMPTAGAKQEEEDANEVEETQGFCRALQEKVEIMQNRMRSNLLRGRSIVNDSSIHSLFAQLTDHHGQVLGRIAKLEADREYYESQQDHLAHIQEARQAVNALREEHARQVQERLQEEQRQRQVQMQQKVEIMRHKRHEMLLFQRHAALQRFQEHEAQIAQRKQMQQQHPQMGAMMPSQAQQQYQTPQMYAAPTALPQGYQQVPPAGFPQHQWIPPNHQSQLSGQGGGVPLDQGQQMQQPYQSPAGYYAGHPGQPQQQHYYQQAEQQQPYSIPQQPAPMSYPYGQQQAPQAVGALQHTASGGSMAAMAMGGAYSAMQHSNYSHQHSQSPANVPLQHAQYQQYAGGQQYSGGTGQPEHMGYQGQPSATYPSHQQVKCVQV